MNQQVAKKALELAELLQPQRRTELNNTSGFSTSTHYHVVDLIEAASDGNPLFEGYVAEGLRCLSGQFDLMYWRGLADIVRELANDALLERFPKQRTPGPK